MVTYGFFNSINGDRTYDADALSNFFLHLIPNGILKDSAQAPLMVAPVTGMNLSINAGYAFINAKYFHNDFLTTISLPASDSTLDRIDRVVLRLDRDERKILLAVHAGEPSGTPTAPDLTRTATVYELSLATVTVSAGATEITSGDITDDRLSSSLCGLITGFEALGGLSLYPCTQEEYDGMSHDPRTLYIIVEEE